MNINVFLHERDAALMSLDKDKILSYCRKYKIRIPSNEKVFWSVVHKARIAIKSFSNIRKRSITQVAYKKWIQGKTGLNEK